MKDLLRKAQENLTNACEEREDVCSIRYHLGYIQALKDVDRKMKTEGLDELEGE